MTIIDEGKQLRLEAAKLRPDRRRRYPSEFRRKVLGWVDRAVAVGFTEAECGKALGIKTWRFTCWKRAPALTEEAEASEPLSMIPIGITSSTTGLTLVA